MHYNLQPQFNASPQSIQSISTVHNLNHPTNMDNKNEATGEFHSLNDSLTPMTVNRQAVGSHSHLDRMQRSLSVGLHTHSESLPLDLLACSRMSKLTGHCGRDGI